MSFLFSQSVLGIQLQSLDDIHVQMSIKSQILCLKVSFCSPFYLFIYFETYISIFLQFFCVTFSSFCQVDVPLTGLMVFLLLVDCIVCPLTRLRVYSHASESVRLW